MQHTLNSSSAEPETASRLRNSFEMLEEVHAMVHETSRTLLAQISCVTLELRREYQQLLWQTQNMKQQESLEKSSKGRSQGPSQPTPMAPYAGLSPDVTPTPSVNNGPPADASSRNVFSWFAQTFGVGLASAPVAMRPIADRRDEDNDTDSLDSSYHSPPRPNSEYSGTTSSSSSSAYRTDATSSG